ncbi:hypothetical protein EYF80_015552 [Liparis tanakae]|uniref:Uncharacterized protein n=1 Tax=Liparis tanakae TaxID=230148 RepID=A0A4Z2I8D1_9TELE|nr:hypothetical protein EYF80_015552 [Liparis tanakae]
MSGFPLTGVALENPSLSVPTSRIRRHAQTNTRPRRSVAAAVFGGIGTEICGDRWHHSKGSLTLLTNHQSQSEKHPITVANPYVDNAGQHPHE